jgi:hypothetical protein
MFRTFGRSQWRPPWQRIGFTHVDVDEDRMSSGRAGHTFSAARAPSPRGWRGVGTPKQLPHR